MDGQLLIIYTSVVKGRGIDHQLLPIDVDYRPQIKSPTKLVFLVHLAIEYEIVYITGYKKFCISLSIKNCVHLALSGNVIGWHTPRLIIYGAT